MMERRRLGAVQDLQFVRQDLDVARGHVGVDRPLRALPDNALDGQYVLAANALRPGEDLGPVRIEDDL